MRQYARYTPEMVERVCGISPDDFLRVADTLIENSGRERTTMFCLRARLDPAHQRRADDPGGGDPAAAARQHGPPGRRDHGDARPRVDPGLDRHPDAVRPAARLPADAARPARSEPPSHDYVDVERRRARLVGELRQVHRVAAQGLLRRRRDGGERLRLRAACRRSPATTRTSRRCCAPSTAASTGCSSWARTPPSAPSTPGCSGARSAHLKWLVVRDLNELETATFWRDGPEVALGRVPHRRTSRPRSS